MRSRIVLALAVALCLVLAGCSGSTQSEPATETPTPTSTPSPPDGSVVAYSSLTSTEQVVFDRARANGSVGLGPDSPELDYELPSSAATPFQEHDHVKRNGTYYEVSVADRGFVGSYALDAELTEPGDSETVVAFENVTGEDVAILQQALRDGRYAVPPGGEASFDVSVGTGDVVEYRGETYRLTRIVGDYPTYQVSVTAAD